MLDVVVLFDGSTCTRQKLSSSTIVVNTSTIATYVRWAVLRWIVLAVFLILLKFISKVFVS